MSAHDIIRALIDMATAARNVASDNPDDCCAEATAVALEEAIAAITCSSWE